MLLSILSIFSCQKEVENNKKEINSSLVPIELARQVAEKFNPVFFSKKNSQFKISATNLNNIVSELVYNDKIGQPALYVFNFDKGFVFISADFNLRPVLAYINNGNYKKGKIPAGMKDWINKTIENVEVVRKGYYDNSKAGMMAWNRYLSQHDISTSGEIESQLAESDPCIDPERQQQRLSTYIFSSYVVGPLLPVTWGQSCTYNDSVAPNQSFNCTPCSSGRPPTGCVPTAIAQIMRYHQFPNTYNYASMPTNHGNTAVQQLMRDIGNSAGTTYNCDNSSTSKTIVPTVFKSSFGYSSANRSSYTSSSYLNIRNNIDYDNLPVILEGFDSEVGGHEWVADGITENTYTECGENGYSITYLYFHMNWGFHEDWMNISNSTDYNGWFAYDDWNIPGLNWNFAYSKGLVTEIYP